MLRVYIAFSGADEEERGTEVLRCGARTPSFDLRRKRVKTANTGLVPAKAATWRFAPQRWNLFPRVSSAYHSSAGEIAQTAFLLIVLCLAAGLPARADSAPGFPFAGLAVTASKEIKVTEPNAAVFTFGKRRLPAPGTAQAVFSLRNTTANPLTVDRLQPTCRCTTAVVLMGTNTLPLDRPIPALPPGGSLSVRVTVVLSGHAPGPLVKSVLIFVHGHSGPAAKLDMSGFLLPEPAPKPSQAAKN